MSYDVALRSPADGAMLEMDEPFEEGGTYAVDGTTACTLNITYNYGEVFGPLVRELDGRTACETIEGLRAFCEQWRHARPYDCDYWAPTPGNARAAIARLLSFAEKHPDGVWEVE